VLLAGGLLAAAGLFLASFAMMPAHPEGPPRPLPWYVFYASLAVAALTIAAVGISAWRSGESRRRDLGVRGALMTGTLLTVGFVGFAFHAYLNAPYNRVECARDGYPPHRLACSYHNRNTPLAHRRAGYLTGAGFAVLVGTLGVLGWAEKRRLLVLQAHAPAAADPLA
jgi:hypothetical protein